MTHADDHTTTRLNAIEARVSALEGRTRAALASMDTKLSKHDGDLAELEAMRADDREDLAKLIASHEGMGEIDRPIVSEPGDFAALRDANAERDDLAKRLAEMTKARDSIAMQRLEARETEQANLHALLDALGLAKGETTPHAWQAAIELVRTRLAELGAAIDGANEARNERDAIREVVKLIAKRVGFEGGDQIDLRQLLDRVESLTDRSVHLRLQRLEEALGRSEDT